MTARRAFLYCRVSSTRQAVEGESLAVQQELGEAVCRLENWSLAGVFIEQGISGSKPLVSRPEGSKLVAALQPGDVVIVPKLDRAFRSTRDALETLADFKRRGISLYARDLGGLVGDDSVGELLFSVMSAFASFERARCRERVMETKACLSAQGRYMGGDVPFASRVVEREGEKYLEPDAEVLATLKDLRGKGYSTRLMAGHFAQHGIAVSHHAVARALKRVAA